MSDAALRLGLVGFRDDAEVGRVLARAGSAQRWEISPIAEADALWIGDAADATAPGLQDLHRPVAFTRSPGRRADRCFDPTDVRGVGSVLLDFETALQPLATQMAVASGLAERRHCLASPVYHLMVRGAFVSVVSVHGDVGVLAALTPQDARSAQWCGRPPTAGVVPATFLRLPVAQLMWEYAMRVTEDLLPERYHRLPIHFASPPQVSPRLLTATHLALLGRLATGPQRLDALRRDVGLTELQAWRAVAALYFAGCITTHPGKAALHPDRRAADEISGFGNDAVASAEAQAPGATSTHLVRKGLPTTWRPRWGMR